MNLREFLKKQEQLDKMIFERAGINKYPCKDIKLALLTELGELANEVKFFKYWKQHKEVNREKVLEEFADCLHFALNIENHLKQMNESEIKNLCLLKELIKTNEMLDDAFLTVYKNIVNEESILLSVLGLGICLDISFEEMENSYLKKYQKNIKRQKGGY